MTLNLNKQILIESVLRIIIGLSFLAPAVILQKVLLAEYWGPKPISPDDKTYLYSFLTVFAAMWICISAAISYIGGWQYLKKKYHTKEKTKGFKIAGRSLSIGFGYLPPASYSSCSKIYVADNGLYMKSMFLFRLFHPPLFIPWSDIEKVYYKKWWFFKTIKIRVDKIKIGFFGKTAEGLNQKLG